MLFTDDEIKASKEAWAKWEKAGRPYPMPETRELLTMEEAAAKYGAYPTARGDVPIIPSHAFVTDFRCQHCGDEARGFLEYGGALVCCIDCGYLANPDHPSTCNDPAEQERIKARFAARAEIAELEAKIAAKRAELGV